VTVRHLGQAPNWFDPEPPAVDAAAYAALAKALATQPGDLLVLEELRADGPLATALVERRPDAQLLSGPPAFHVRTGSVRARGGPRRREAGRLARRADDRDTPLRLRATADWAQVEPLLDEVLDLQARAWEGRDPDPFTGTATGRAFVREAVAAMGREDRVRLLRLHVGERMAAFHLSLVWGTRAVVYKTAFDRSLDALPGLGWASLLATIDRLAGEGVRTVDLGPWGDAFKSHIADAVPTVTIRLSLSPVGRAYLGAASAKRRAARLLRVPRLTAQPVPAPRSRPNRPGGHVVGGFG